MDGDASEWSVATWNVNSIVAHESSVLRWVEANHPTVLALQETQCGAARFPTRGFISLGFEVAAHGNAGSNGVAVLSRAPMSDVRLGVPGALAPFDEPRIVSALCHVGSENVRVVSAYAPNGRKVGTDAHTAKLGWFRLLGAVLADLLDDVPSNELVVAADLNIAPTDRDVWDAARYRNRNLTSPKERQAFAELLEGTRLVDVVRAAHPEVTLSSWWNRRSDFFESDRGWRLDHVLATPTLASRARAATIDRSPRAETGSSDHAPVVVRFTSSDS